MPARSPSCRRRWVRLVVGFLSGVGWLAFAGSVPPAGASSVVAAGVVEAVPVPGLSLHVPGDGRLNGDGFAASVTGYRFASQVGYGASTLRASIGQELLVFGLQGLDASVGSSISAASPPAPSALLIVDGAEEALPASHQHGGGPAFYLASIPSGATSVELQVSAQGFTQTFSFSAGARVGLSPVVLYRAASSWEASDPLGDTITMATPDPAENLAGAKTDVTVASGALTWFGPGGPGDYPAGPGEAWLVLNASSQAHPISVLPVGFQLTYLSTLAADQVTLTIAGGGTPMPALIAGKGGNADESTNQSGIFGGVYYWQVPADLSAATVTITPGTITAEDNYLGSPQSIKVAGSAVFSLSFGSPYVPPPPPLSPPAYAAASGSAGAGAGGSSGVPTIVSTSAKHNSSAPLGVTGQLLLVSVVGVLTLIAIVFDRRRRAVLLAVPGGSPAAAAGGRRRRQARNAGPSESHRGWPEAGVDRPVYREQGPPGGQPASRSPLGTSSDTAPSAEPYPVPVVAPDTAAPSSAVSPAVSDCYGGASRSPVEVPPAGDPPYPPAAPATAGVLVVVPDGPPQVGEGRVRVEVLGSPRVVGWPEGVAPPGQSVLELLAFLALHPGQRFSTEQLRSRLGAGRSRDLDPGTVRRYINELRRALGDARVPESKAGGRYEVLGVDADAVEFARLTVSGRLADPAKANEASRDGVHHETDPDSNVAVAGRLAAALSMVRAAPFSDTARGTYGWADIDLNLSADMSNGIQKAAVRLAQLALDANDRELALWAVSKGILVWPCDEELSMAFLDSAAGDPGRLDAAWTQTVARLGVCGDSPSARLGDHYRRLRSHM